jgi:hypothetical protein
MPPTDPATQAGLMASRRAQLIGIQVRFYSAFEPPVTDAKVGFVSGIGPKPGEVCVTFFTDPNVATVPVGFAYNVLVLGMEDPVPAGVKEYCRPCWPTLDGPENHHAELTEAESQILEDWRVRGMWTPDDELEIGGQGQGETPPDTPPAPPPTPAASTNGRKKKRTTKKATGKKAGAKNKGKAPTAKGKPPARQPRDPDEPAPATLGNFAKCPPLKGLMRSKLIGQIQDRLPGGALVYNQEHRGLDVCWAGELDRPTLQLRLTEADGTVSADLYGRSGSGNLNLMDAGWSLDDPAEATALIHRLIEYVDAVNGAPDTAADRDTARWQAMTQVMNQAA